MPGNQKLQDSAVNCHPPLKIDELPKEDEERLEKLFGKLDSDGDGKIDIHDLSLALREFGLHHRYAEKFLAQSDSNASGDVCLSEFIHYVREHEKNLKLQFTHLDKNQDGKVDLEELISAFADLGIAMDRREATNLLKRMDQDGSLNISYDEWRDYLLLAPSTDIHGLINFWRHSTVTRGHGRDKRNSTINEGLKKHIFQLILCLYCIDFTVDNLKSLPITSNLPPFSIALINFSFFSKVTTLQIFVTDFSRCLFDILNLRRERVLDTTARLQ